MKFPLICCKVASVVNTFSKSQFLGMSISSIPLLIPFRVFSVLQILIGPINFTRLGGSGILNGSVESLGQMKTFQCTNVIPRRIPESLEPSRTLGRCPKCTENYEKELAKLVANEYEKSSSEVRSEPTQPPLPQWLQNAKSDNGNATLLDQSKVLFFNTDSHLSSVRIIFGDSILL